MKINSIQFIKSVKLINEFSEHKNPEGDNLDQNGPELPELQGKSNHPNVMEAEPKEGYVLEIAAAVIM